MWLWVIELFCTALGNRVVTFCMAVGNRVVMFCMAVGNRVVMFCMALCGCDSDDVYNKYMNQLQETLLNMLLLGENKICISYSYVSHIAPIMKLFHVSDFSPQNASLTRTIPNEYS